MATTPRSGAGPSRGRPARSGPAAARTWGSPVARRAAAEPATWRPWPRESASRTLPQLGVHGRRVPARLQPPLGTIQMHGRTNQTQYLWMPPEQHLASLFWHLPLVTGGRDAGRACNFYKEWIRHPELRRILGKPATSRGLRPDRRAGVRPGRLVRHVPPVHARTTSWACGAATKVLIGPWIHSLGTGAGAGARGTSTSDRRRWSTCGRRAPLVRPLAEGDRLRRAGRAAGAGLRDGRQPVAHADDWPVPGTRFVGALLPRGRPRQLAVRRRPARPPAAESEPPDQFVYDPREPVPTLGGSTCCGEDVTPIPMGPRDQRPAEWRPDVLCYTTAPLEADVEVTGPVKVVLWAASTAPDTDFTAKLVDVFPSGYAMNVAQGIIRARYHDSWTTPTLLEPGRVYRYEIDCWSSSNCFLRRPPHPGGDLLVELSPVRPEPQHGARLRHGRRAAPGDADRLSRRRASVAHRAADRRLTAPWTCPVPPASSSSEAAWWAAASPTIWHAVASGTCVVLERDAVGAGTTSKAAGGIRAQFATETEIRFSLESRRVFETFAEEFGSIRLHPDRLPVPGLRRGRPARLRGADGAPARARRGRAPPGARATRRGSCLDSASTTWSPRCGGPTTPWRGPPR